MSVRKLIIIVAFLCLATGCSLVPDMVRQPQYHNPFPQLARVAVLPFTNLSQEPTVDGIRIAEAYYSELQQIPGFEVMPVRAAVAQLTAHGLTIETDADFQEAARVLGVDVVIVGAVTDYTPYYPPRLGLTVNWYSANPGFHPIPPGYGLPWGTAEEEYIPESLVFEAEFALAREQLATQSPLFERTEGGGVRPVSAEFPLGDETIDGAIDPSATTVPGLPANWPDPRGFIPPPPRSSPPDPMAYTGPIIEHTRNYNGHDSDFTTALANYYYFRDDARFGGWQAYLQRSDDFIRFCCHLHITETLAARGGTSESRLVLRWPIGRYER